MTDESVPKPRWRVFPFGRILKGGGTGWQIAEIIASVGTRNSRIRRVDLRAVAPQVRVNIRDAKLPRDHHPVLLERGPQSGGQFLGRTRFSQEAEYMSLINRVSSGFLIGISGEHDPHSVGRTFLRFLKKFQAVHSRHLHVCHDDGIGTFGAYGPQRFAATNSNIDGELLAQIPLKSR